MFPLFLFFPTQSYSAVNQRQIMTKKNQIILCQSKKRHYLCARVCPGGEIGRHASLRGWCSQRACRFKSCPGHEKVNFGSLFLYPDSSIITKKTGHLTHLNKIHIQDFFFMQECNFYCVRLLRMALEYPFQLGRECRGEQCPESICISLPTLRW